eukprot:SM000003S11106  [mRNA]  locus=s3:978329:978820:- [translate_table: standard]
MAAERQEYRDDMNDSYGDGYAGRSADEGFGQIYGEPVTSTAVGKTGNAPASWDTGEQESTGDVLAKDPPKERDQEQGSEVAEKEHARNATKETAFKHEA